MTYILFVSTVYPQQRRQAQNKSSRSKSITPPKTAEAKWRTFNGPDNDFTVDFPANPKRDEDVQGPVTVLRRYVSATATTYFEISLQDFGGDPDSKEANSYDPEFEQNLSQMLSRKGGKVVQIRRTAKNVYEMEAWYPSATAGKYMHNLSRGILHKGRQYVMSCNSLTVEQEVDRSVCRRFFNSFTLSKRAGNSR